MIKEWIKENRLFIDQTVEEIRHSLYGEELLSLLEDAQALQSQGKLREAIRALNEVSRLYPWEYMPPYELAIAYDRIKDYDRALLYIGRVIIAYPNEQYRWHSLAVILTHSGDPEGGNVALAISEMIAGKTAEDQ